MSTTKTTIGLAGIFGIAAFLSISTLGTAIFEIRANQQARTALAAANQEFATVSEQLHAWELKAQAAEQSRSERLAQAEAAKSDAVAAANSLNVNSAGAGGNSGAKTGAGASANSWDPVAEGQKFLSEFPQARALFIQSTLPTINKQLAPFIRGQNLSPSQAAQLEYLVASNGVNSTLLGPTPSQTGWSQENPSFDQLSQILGSQGAQAYESYQQTMRYPYEFANGMMADAAIAGTPLTTAQNDQIAQIIASNAAPYQRVSGSLGGPANWNAAVTAVNWEAAIAQVQAALPASQFNAIQGNLQGLQLNAAEVQLQQSAAKTNP